jgi:serine/threonine-protein kinase
MRTLSNHERGNHRVGDYQLGDTVETGTHTVVYRARRPSDGRHFLVKTLKKGLRANEELRAALARERSLLETANHPGLPTVVELIDEADTLALVYLDRRGHRLTAVLERSTRLPVTTALAVSLELCGPLAALHRAGIAHGGLRADVVELTEGGGVFVHAADAYTRGSGEEPLMLPDHLAPEQLVGDKPQPHTDVFSIGALLYRMIAGTYPFARGEGAVSQSIRHSQPRALGARDRGVPSHVDKIVLRCLQKRPEDRFGDATTLASALAQALTAETSLPNWILVSRALSAAGLADDLPPPREQVPLARARFRPPAWLRRALAPVAIGVGASLALGLLWLALREPEEVGGASAIRRPAQLRVLAHPWAEVHIDGKLVDVTPIGMPIEVSPGRHKVTFKHPNAPDELRTVDIVEGQTIVLDVEMRVVLPQDAGKAEPVPDAPSEEEP